MYYSTLSLGMFLMLSHICHLEGFFPTTRLGHSLKRNIYPRTQTSKRFQSTFTEEDQYYLSLAVQHAQHGLGHTYPNPAVGCVLVQNNHIIGEGFHPRAGMPHAEVFALWQASKHLPNGVAAAQAVLEKTKVKPSSSSSSSDTNLLHQVTQLTQRYIHSHDDGPKEMFQNLFIGTNTTAYVTLEPCCHLGKRTPPCATSLTLAGVSRVVVGIRDPNPSVDGGGFLWLQNAGVEVVTATEGTIVHDQCTQLIRNFIRRMILAASSKPEKTAIASLPSSSASSQTSNICKDDIATSLTGAQKRALRALAGRQKTNQKLPKLVWTGASVPNSLVGAEEIEIATKELPWQASWMEELDGLLWDHELVILRLNTAVHKKKAARILGERLSAELKAHLVQVVGHTALLYRPSIPPIMQLDELDLKVSANEEVS
jgi:riboflavin biosynthesis protein RibD